MPSVRHRHLLFNSWAGVLKISMADFAMEVGGESHPSPNCCLHFSKVAAPIALRAMLLCSMDGALAHLGLIPHDGLMGGRVVGQWLLVGGTGIMLLLLLLLLILGEGRCRTRLLIGIDDHGGHLMQCLSSKRGNLSNDVSNKDSSFVFVDFCRSRIRGGIYSLGGEWLNFSGADTKGVE